MEFIETHCHLDDDAFATDLPQIIDLAQENGVQRFVNIGYEPESWTRSIALKRANPYIFFSLGMHPNSADRWSDETARELSQLIESNRPVAIGEIGLDFYREWVDQDAQRIAFRDQLALADRFQLPVILHIRGDVETEILANLSEFPLVRAVFHSFDGSSELRDFAIERGDFFGVGGLMTRSGSTALRDVLKDVPIDSIVLETDSPYLVPRGAKDRRNTPAAILQIAAAVADLLNRSIDEIAASTTANAVALFPQLAALPFGVEH